MEQRTDAITGLADRHKGSPEQVQAAASLLKAVSMPGILQGCKCNAGLFHTKQAWKVEGQIDATRYRSVCGAFKYQLNVTSMKHGLCRLASVPQLSAGH